MQNTIAKDSLCENVKENEMVLAKGNKVKFVIAEYLAVEVELAN